jgi:hypothetical protein
MNRSGRRRTLRGRSAREIASASARLRRTSLRLYGTSAALPSRGRAGACRQARSDLTVCRPERGAVRPQSDPRRRHHSSARCQTGPAAARQGLEALAHSQATLRRLPPAAAAPARAARERKILLVDPPLRQQGAPRQLAGVHPLPPADHRAGRSGAPLLLRLPAAPRGDEDEAQALHGTR